VLLQYGLTWLAWGTIAHSQINAYNMAISFAVILTLGTSFFALLMLAPQYAVRKRAIDMHRIKHASERFMATLQTDHRYMALAFCDILKIIISLILLSSADYLSL
jgi:hypothetical protein